MDMNGSERIEAPLGVVWQALNDCIFAEAQELYLRSHGKKA